MLRYILPVAAIYVGDWGGGRAPKALTFADKGTSSLLLTSFAHAWNQSLVSS